MYSWLFLEWSFCLIGWEEGGREEVMVEMLQTYCSCQVLVDFLEYTFHLLYVLGSVYRDYKCIYYIKTLNIYI